MNKLPSKKYYSNLDSLVTVIEQWHLVVNEMEDLQNNFTNLPVDLIALKQHLKDFDSEIESNSNIQSNYLNEKKVKEIVEYLNSSSLKLIKLNKNTQNLVALRETIEAVQDNYKFIASPDYNEEFFRLAQLDQHLPKKKPGLQLINQIKTFKRVYPENFWSIFLAFFLLLVFGWRATVTNTSKSEPSLNQTEIIDRS